MSANEQFFWQVNENNFIEFKDGQMTAKNNWRTVTDKIENYTLKYFKLSKRLRVHFILQNFENIVQWEYRGVVKREDKEVVEKFVRIMQSYGLCQNKSTLDVIFGDTEQESRKFLSKFKPGERKCPECGGKNFHAFVEEKVIHRGGLFHSRRRYMMPPEKKYVSKFVCDDCGKIF